jgi:hypothetical protein
MNPDLDEDEAERARRAAWPWISGHKGDAFARALDVFGWMIVPQPHCDDGQRWPIEGPGACPSWAERLTPLKPPALRLIEGGKDDAPPHN